MSSTVETLSKKLSWLPPGLSRWMERRMKSIPALRKMVEKEQEDITATLEHSLKPYHNTFERHKILPKQGIERGKIMDDIRKMHELESSRWQEGYVSGGIYHGDAEHIKFLNEVYALHSQSNPLHSDLFPSATKMEAEIVSMVATMLGKGQTTDNKDVVGTVTSGGTESILLAMKTYRDRALEEKGIEYPEMIVATTAHAAFDKASQYFGIKMVRVGIDENFRMNVKEAKQAINRNTIVIVGSAPTFPHGAIDPIKELSDLALANDIGFHTDCCLGGFVIPFAEKAGINVPIVDFRLPGVTSISVDTHKYGYAAKGTSVILYRGESLRHFQFYTITDWPGGLYFSPTLAGSRPGALSAACWASLLSMGEDGYTKASKSIVETANQIKAGIKTIPELKLFGDPLFVIAFGSDTVNVYEVLDQMTNRKWNLNGLHKPSCVHIAVTLRHTQPGVAERFISDLRDSVEYVKANPGNKEGSAPVYGMAASLPFRGMVSDILKKYLDVVYKA